MKEITISLNPQEAEALVKLLDAAVRSAGLQVAGAAEHFRIKLENAAKAAAEAEQRKPEPVPEAAE